MKRKYNLTFLQRIELIPIFILWICANNKNRKQWHEVKKGMEKHKHNFTKPFASQGYLFMQCDHEGCNLCEPIS